MSLRGSSWWFMCLGPCHPCSRPRRSNLLLALTWSNPSHCGHWRNESAGGRSLCLSAFQINLIIFFLKKGGWRVLGYPVWLQTILYVIQVDIVIFWLPAIYNTRKVSTEKKNYTRWEPSGELASETRLKCLTAVWPWVSYYDFLVCFTVSYTKSFFSHWANADLWEWNKKHRIRTACR